MNSEKSSLRIIAAYITRNAHQICKKIARLLPYEVVIKRLPLKGFKDFFKSAFEFDAIVAVMATGIVVRGIAPFLKDKKCDPAVVVLDEKGRFVISLISGHIGGANRLANEIAHLLNAQAVITTASDANDLPAIDVYAKEQNYHISDPTLYKKIAMKIIKGETIPVYIERGEPSDFFKQRCFRILKKNEFINVKGLKIAVSSKNFVKDSLLFLVPKRLVLGMGFHRGLGEAELYSFVKECLDRKGYFIEAVKKLATIDKRKTENGFLHLCKRLKAEALFFSEQDLASVRFLKQSETVKKYHSSGNISEAAAYLGSGKGKIVVPKIKGGNITLCIAKEKYLSLD
ncbi:MAG: cobalt-precorrin 5A hydrolase [bacterium]